MVQNRQSNLSLTSGEERIAPTLEELRIRRQERREVNKRVDELKLKLFRLTEGHMEQTIRVLRTWLSTKKEMKALR